MNKFTVLFGLLLCLVTVNGRHYAERADSVAEAEQADEEVRKAREHSPGENKHRRRRWQAGYNYQQPAYPFYADDRRDYDRNQDYMPQILRLLEEISTYVKRPQPPPPPQPIYVPYPVPYPIPQYCRCPTRRVNGTNVSFNTRLPDMEDVRQNWGIDVSGYVQDFNDGDGSRPLTFDPLVPPGVMSRPSAKVEPTKQSSKPSEARVPRTCEAAIITCCRPNDSREQQKSCFTDLGCAMTYNNGVVCTRDNILTVLDSFSAAYSPVNN